MTGGLAAGEAARYLFGLAIILVILFEPAGLAGILNRITGRGRAAVPRAASRLHLRLPIPPTPHSVRSSSTREHHMKLGKGSRSVVVVAAAVVVTATGCSTKAPETSGGGGGGEAADVQTDIGVEGETITLGVLTDLTGVFAALGNDITNANKLFWENNQVCDTYDVELNIQDTGYVPQQGVQLYSGMKDSVLAMQQTIGSPINTALAPEYEADEIVNFPSAWSKTLTEIPGTGVLGATYDVEIANGYSYLFEEGLLKEGDKVGHIYFEGEYGANGLAGTKAVAEEMNLDGRRAADQGDRPGHERPDHPVQGGRASTRSSSPSRPRRRRPPPAWPRPRASTSRSSAATRSSRPACSPGPTADVLKERLYVAAPFSTFDQHPEELAAYEEAYPDATPSLGVRLRLRHGRDHEAGARRGLRER